MGDESLFPGQDDAHRAARLARQQAADQLDMQRFRPAAKSTADMRLDDMDAPFRHVEAAGDHQMHVERHLGTASDQKLVALGIVLRERRMGFDLCLADFSAFVGIFPNQVRFGELIVDFAEIVFGLPFDIARPLLVQVHGLRRGRFLCGVVGGQFPVGHLDLCEGRQGRRVVDCRDCRHGFSAIAHPFPRQGIFVHRDGQDAERLVAVGAGDDGYDAGQRLRCAGIDGDDLGMPFRAAQYLAGKCSERRKVGGVVRATGDLVRTVEHRYARPDRVRRLHDIAHGAAAA